MNRRTHALLAACSAIALLWVLAARLIGPSDLYEKDQPKTMSYTTDIITEGRWVLPTEMGGAAATKPPLYNWIAVPFVKALGPSSEIAHRMPSILAFIGCWALLVWVGGRIGGPCSSIGWLAGMVFLASAATFKLGLLARPDTLLTLWLLLGWVFATHLLVARSTLATSPRLALQLGFWLCVALAALAKGPPALVLILYAAIAPRLISGSWSEARVFAFSWGVPVAVAPFTAWIYAAHLIEPDHVVSQLWAEEVLGRVTGLGEEGNRDGPIEFLYRLGHMPLYYLSRFLPWSVVSILAMVELWKRRRAPMRAGTGGRSVWLVGAAVMLLIVIAFFSVSTGKRAAYIAAAYGPGALLAAWWIVRCGAARHPRAVSIAVIVIAGLLGGLTVYDQLDRQAPVPGFGDAVESFILESAREIQKEPSDSRAVITLWDFDYLLLRAMLAGPFIEDHEALASAALRGETIWLFARGGAGSRDALRDALEELDITADLHPAVVSAELPPAARWPGRVTLWRLTPQ